MAKLAQQPVSTANKELLTVADAVAREMNVPFDAVVDALARAIATAGRKKYGHEHHVEVEIDRKTGELTTWRVQNVVELVEDPHTQISLEDAKKKDKTVEIGGQIKESLPPFDFNSLGRVAAQMARQIIVQGVRDAQREIQFDEFKDRVGEIISGTVKRVEYGNVIVDFGRTEAMIRRDELIPREQFRPGDRIRAYIFDVRREKTGPQIFLSRTRPEFLAKLFAQEVPEIYDGIIEIKAVARDPGSRAKIAVMSHDGGVNPVLSCVGVRGARVQAVVSELQGEKIDIIEWSADPATFVVNALSSAEVSKVVIDEDDNRIEVVVPDDQLSLAIGRRGQNVRLASQLAGWSIDILTEAVESERRAEEFKTLSTLFIEALDVEEMIAQLLVTEGYTSVEEIAYVPEDELAGIEGFDENIAQELQQRAKNWLEEKRREVEEKLDSLGVKEDLRTLEGISSDLLIALGEKNIKTRDDLAELATDEFTELLPDSGLKHREIEKLIMDARAHWFEDEEPAAGDNAAEEEGS